jgi:nitrate/TMAO reductase-like tetraheme cytochrome c subunit
MTTYLGGISLSIFFIIEIFLILMDILTTRQNLYLGILTYVIFPFLLLISITFILFGIYLKKKRSKARKDKINLGGKSSSEKVLHFHYDSQNPVHNKRLIITIIFTICFLMVSSLGTYKVYEFTESNEFCGTVCHDVMHPEYLAHGNSPHSQLKCVDCHIGSGVNAYFKAKVSGLHQVIGVITGDYSKPIPSPLHKMRSAKEICSTCHSIDYKHENIQKDYAYFVREEDNKKWNIKMLLKTSDIHKSHANSNAAKIFYVSDKENETIPWVKVVRPNGEKVIYKASDEDGEVMVVNEETQKEMDCLGCHNRPAHNFISPNDSLNKAMAKNLINVNIPSIKDNALEILEKPFYSKEEALKEISNFIMNYYKTNEEDYFSKNKPEIKKAINSIKDIYTKNFFPEMNVRWSSYSNFNNHKDTTGCFRCHDSNHISDKGSKIPNDCNTCHLIIEQGYDNTIEKNTAGLTFTHPTDIDKEWKETKCSECHTGGFDE